MRLFNPILFLGLFICHSQLCSSQVIKGKTVDADTKTPIPYVGIGVLHNGFGTVSDLNGDFILDISKVNLTDTLRCSCIGYANKDFTIKSFRQNPDTTLKIFELNPESNQLNEVVVKSANNETKVIGNTISSGPVYFGFHSTMLGTELGTVLKYRKDNPGLIENINFNLAVNHYDSVLFEVNIYNYDDGVIGKSLLKRPLYLQPKVRTGTLTIDLKDSSIYIKHDVLLSLELIRISAMKDTIKTGYAELMFYYGILNSPSYYRDAAQDTWIKLSMGGVGFWATVSYNDE